MNTFTSTMQAQTNKIVGLLDSPQVFEWIKDGGTARVLHQETEQSLTRALLDIAREGDCIWMCRLREDGTTSTHTLNVKCTDFARFLAHLRGFVETALMEGKKYPYMKVSAESNFGVGWSTPLFKSNQV